MKYTENEAIGWLTRADPVASDAPLTTEHERTRLMARIAATEPAHIETRSFWRPRFTIAAATVLGLLAVITVLIPNLGFPQRAQALTPPSLIYSDTSMGSHDMLNRLRSKLHSTDSAAPQREADYIGWFIELRADEDVSKAVIIAPQRVRLTWEADLSGTQVVEAAASYWADPNNDSIPEDAPPPGTVLSSTTFAPGEFRVPFTELVGDSAAQMRTTMQAVGLPNEHTAADVIDAADALMSLWTLTPAQHAAVLMMLDDAGDARVLGVATDRLGRTVVGFAAESATFPGTQRILLVEQSTGLIVGVEVSRTTAESPLPVGAVISYKLWKGAK